MSERECWYWYEEQGSWPMLRGSLTGYVRAAESDLQRIANECGYRFPHQGIAPEKKEANR